MREIKVSQEKQKRRNTRLIFGISILWLAAACFGFGLIARYENTPGTQAQNSGQFPSASRIRRSANRPIIVMLAHPHCPCTRASIGELARLMEQTEGRADAYVLFLKPRDLADDWEQTDLWQSAAAIPGVTVLADEDGTEAELFGASISSQTLLYDTDGKLLFKGGITSARGHSGDNDGRSAIVSFLNTGQSEQTETPVYGCPLFNRKDDCPL